MSTYLSTKPKPRWRSLLTSAGKSKKDFKPKAPSRRPPVPSPNQSTLRVSVESQSQSQRQTPQLQAATVGHRPSPGAESNHSTLRYASDNVVSISTDRARKSKTPDQLLPPRRNTSQHAPRSSPAQQNESSRIQPAPSGQSHTSRSTTTTRVPKPSTRRRSQEHRALGGASLSHSPIMSSSSARARPASQAPVTEQSETPPYTRSANVARPPESQETEGRRLSRRLIARSEKHNDSLQVAPNNNDIGVVREDSTDVSQAASTINTAPEPPSANRQKKRKAVEQEDPQKAEAKRAKRISRLQKIADSIVAEAAGEAPKATKPRRGRRKRQTTPENPETVEIAPNSTKMADLCRDRHAGKNSTREARLAERERDEKAGKALEKLNELMGETQETPQQQDQPLPYIARKPRLARLRGRPSTPLAQLAPQVRLVNGQIVQDEASRVVDRHAVADGVRDEDEDVHEEDDLTRRTNNGSHLKRLPPFRWSDEMTEQFYEGLRLFGTDFMMMTVLFPGLTRRQLKLKFVKEERTNEETVKQVLIHERKTPDLEELQRLANVVYREPAAVEKELEEDRKRLEEEDRLEREAMEQMERERREAVEREARQGEGPAVDCQDGEHQASGADDEEGQPEHNGAENPSDSTGEVPLRNLRSTVKALGDTSIARPSKQAAASAA